MHYQIRIKGHLKNLTNWFEDFSIKLEDDGDTVLTGFILDQAALLGLLIKINDLGINLVSVIPVSLKKSRNHSST